MIETPSIGSLPLPEDPALAAIATALREAGHWADIVDRHWRHVYVTDELRLSFGGLQELVPVAIGAHYFGPEAARLRLGWRTGPNTTPLLRQVFAFIGGWVLADTPGGRDELAELVPPTLRDLVDQLSPAGPPPAESFASQGMLAGRNATGIMTALRVHDAAGRLAGTAMIMKPAAGMGVLATMAAGGALRSPHSATKSTKRLASRPAPPADAHSPPRHSSSASARTMPPPSGSTLTTLPTPPSPI